MKAIAFAILYLGTLLEGWAQPKGIVRDICQATSSALFVTALLFAITGW